MEPDDPLSNEDSYFHRPGTVCGDEESEDSSPFWDRMNDLFEWLGSFPTVLMLIYVTALLTGLAWTACKTL